MAPLPRSNPEETPREVYRRLRHQGRDDLSIANFMDIRVEELHRIVQDEEAVLMRAID